MLLPFLLTLFSTTVATPQVQLGVTTLVGRNIPSLKQEFFGGIPFAEPPLGSLRLKPPVPKFSIDATTFDASNFGLGCLQPGVPESVVSEDCLTINVLRPAGLTANDSVPVMAWIYGGGFSEGASSVYNGSAIVAQSAARGTPVIYVNFNYRLGPLGFPTGQEAVNRGALNLGLKDQLAGLEWIQKSIGAFGGDKSKVTVFGESAGAMSIAILFLNSNLQTLARAAIFESGSAGTDVIFEADRPDHVVNWQNFVKAVPDCSSLAQTENAFSCLRSANSSAFLPALITSTAAADQQYPWAPTLDGPEGVLPDLPSRLFAKGQFARLPFITGTNLDEGTLFTPPNVNYTAQIIHNTVVANYSPPFNGAGTLNAAVSKLLRLYPNVPALGSPIGTGNETFGLSPGYKRMAMIMNDVYFQSQRRYWIQTASNAGVKTFGYLFTDPQPQNPPSLGVSHGAEVSYFYGAPSSASAIKLSGLMIDYWISFATSLDPNDGLGNQRPEWPQYTPNSQVLIQLNGANTTTIPDDYREEQIAYINSQLVTFHH